MNDSGVGGSRPNRDMIVVGASAGGLQYLQLLVRGLPADLPAAVLIVQHIGARSYLAEILDRDSRLKVEPAISGKPIEHGRVYVAVPGTHLLVHDSHLLLRRGPRENMVRPAIDPLFRTAACSYGARVIGVILSGALNDGTAGLRAIKRCGGIAVVQDPDEAPFPDMPASALLHVEIDHRCPVAKMGALFARLAAEPAGETPDIPTEIKIEAAIAAMELSGMRAEDQLGRPSTFTCPECHGTLWEIWDGDLIRYRCHVGHAYTGEAMLEAQSDNIEDMLWDLLRTHRERAVLARKVAQKERSNQLAARMNERASGYEEDAEIVERLIKSRGVAVPSSGEDDTG